MRKIHAAQGQLALARLAAAGIAGALLAVGSSAARADRQVLGVAIATAALVGAAIASPEQPESDHLAFEAGRFDAIRKVRGATAFGLEYRSGRVLWWKLRPFAGAGFTTRHSFYGYGGIRLATHWGEHLILSPSFAVGGYSRGDGKDLGSPAILGRSGVDLQYRFDDDLRIGVAYHHYSNGKVFGQHNNPGTEIVGVTLTLPLR
jgi:lipid A 3-O-deacylase